MLRIVILLILVILPILLIPESLEWPRGLGAVFFLKIRSYAVLSLEAGC